MTDAGTAGSPAATDRYREGDHERFALVPAAYLFLRREGQVLLQLRQGTGYRDGFWACAAAGHVEEGSRPSPRPSGKPARSSAWRSRRTTCGR
nr:hypothetical protein GCM10025730_11760 [Promicromonospora thailandica]